MTTLLEPSNKRIRLESDVPNSNVPTRSFDNKQHPFNPASWGVGDNDENDDNDMEESYFNRNNTNRNNENNIHNNNTSENNYNDDNDNQNKNQNDDNFDNHYINNHNDNYNDNNPIKTEIISTKKYSPISFLPNSNNVKIENENIIKPEYNELNSDKDDDINNKIENNFPTTASNFIKNYFDKHGYVHGQGLGKTGEGITSPIETHDRTYIRAGIGYEEEIRKIGFIPVNHEYVEEKVDIKIKPSWCPLLSHEPYSKKQIDEWTKLETRVDHVGGEWDGTFCDIALQQKINEAKSKFDAIGKSPPFKEARNKANPFEGITKEIFQNRAALKMCEIDRCLNYLITNPPNCINFQNDRKIIHDQILEEWKQRKRKDIQLHDESMMTRECIYFADICAGPGGFTEYFLHVNTWQCRGYGFTLRGPDDFKLNKFNSNAPYDNFTPYYGEDDTGDITKTKNIQSFRDQVIVSSKTGCHVVMADGGFDCFPDYNSQELLSRQLVLCQFATAMCILRKGGVFICKLFDVFHPFTASLIYILRMYFDEVGLIKPNQSRPANSERYIVCKGFKLSNELIVSNNTNNNNDNHNNNTNNNANNNAKHGSQQAQTSPLHYIVQHLLKINDMMNECIQTKENQVGPLIPTQFMDASFIQWLKNFNEQNGERQLRHLERIKHYLEDKNLRIDDQIMIRKQALDYWFLTSNGPRIFLDQLFGQRFVTNRPDYNFCHPQGQPTRPVSTLICNDANCHVKQDFAKELLDRIRFEINHYSTKVTTEDLVSKESDFYKYRIRGDWFVIAHEILYPRFPPEWVLLISSKHGIFEMSRNEKNDFPCNRITNKYLRLPADSVIDCIKVFNPNTNGSVYWVVDAWVIGSKPIYKRPYFHRQEFCRVLVRAYNSPYLLLCGGVPLLQSLENTQLQNVKDHLILWFMRIKKNAEAKETGPKKDESKYWRPCAIKVWISRDGFPKFDDLLDSLRCIDEKQKSELLASNHHKHKHHLHRNENNYIENFGNRNHNHTSKHNLNLKPQITNKNNSVINDNKNDNHNKTIKREHNNDDNNKQEYPKKTNYHSRSYLSYVQSPPNFIDETSTNDDNKDDHDNDYENNNNDYNYDYNHNTDNENYNESYNNNNNNNNNNNHHNNNNNNNDNNNNDNNNNDNYDNYDDFF